MRTLDDNLAGRGHRTCQVSDGPTPRFFYTSGVGRACGAELVLAGGYYYSVEQVGRIVDAIATDLGTGGGWRARSFAVESLGVFTLRRTHASWTRLMLPEAFDSRGAQGIDVLQIVPDEAHRTADVPDMAQAWSAEMAPIWRWLREPWTKAVPARSVAVTNLDALRGRRISEAARLAEGGWALFAGPGPNVPKHETRTVPLGTLLAMDASLDAVTQLEVGGALWRDGEALTWLPWGSAALRP